MPSETDKERLAELKNAQGNELCKLGKYSNAIYLYESAINLNPNESKYYSNQSACYINIGEILKAQASAQKALDLDQKNLKPYLRVIKCCLIIGNLQHASKTIKTVLRTFQQNDEIQELNKKIELLQKYYDKYQNKLKTLEYEDALKILEHCISLQPNSILFILDKSKCLIKLHRFETALLSINDIPKAQENNEDVIYIKICAQCYQLDVKKALPLIKNIKRSNPNHSQIDQLYKNTKSICSNINKIENAIQELNYDLVSLLIKETLKIDSNYIVTIKELHQRRIDMAEQNQDLHWNGVKACEEYLTTYGFDLHTLKRKVKLLMKLQEYEDAIQDFKVILKVESSEENKSNLKQAEDLFEEQIIDDYKLLRLPKNPTKKQIKTAADCLILRYHPDKNPNVSPEQKKYLNCKTVRVLLARDRLYEEHFDN